MESNLAWFALYHLWPNKQLSLKVESAFCHVAEEQFVLGLFGARFTGQSRRPFICWSLWKTAVCTNKKEVFLPLHALWLHLLGGAQWWQPHRGRWLTKHKHKLSFPWENPVPSIQWIKATVKDHLSGQVSFSPLESSEYHQSWANVIFQKLRWNPLNIKLTVLQYTMWWLSQCHFGHHENVFTLQVTALQNILPGPRNFDLDGLFKFTQTLNPHSSFYRWITRFRESCARSCSQWQNQHLNLYLHVERFLLYLMLSFHLIQALSNSVSDGVGTGTQSWTVQTWSQPSRGSWPPEEDSRR